MVGIEKWDERRLAYEIKHRKRGCYALTYFKAPASSLAGIERDALLSEMILRLLVVSCNLDHEQLGAFRSKAAEQSVLLKEKPETAPDTSAEPVPTDDAMADSDQSSKTEEAEPAEKPVDAPGASPAPDAAEAPTDSADDEQPAG